MYHFVFNQINRASSYREAKKINLQHKLRYNQIQQSMNINGGVDLNITSPEKNNNTHTPEQTETKKITSFTSNVKKITKNVKPKQLILRT